MGSLWVDSLAPDDAMKTRKVWILVGLPVALVLAGAVLCWPRQVDVAPIVPRQVDVELPAPAADPPAPVVEAHDEAAEPVVEADAVVLQDARQGFYEQVGLQTAEGEVYCGVPAEAACSGDVCALVVADEPGWVTAARSPMRIVEGVLVHKLRLPSAGFPCARAAEKLGRTGGLMPMLAAERGTLCHGLHRQGSTLDAPSAATVGRELCEVAAEDLLSRR